MAFKLSADKGFTFQKIGFHNNSFCCSFSFQTFFRESHLLQQQIKIEQNAHAITQPRLVHMLQGNIPIQAENCQRRSVNVSCLSDSASVISPVIKASGCIIDCKEIVDFSPNSTCLVIKWAKFVAYPRNPFWNSNILRNTPRFFFFANHKNVIYEILRFVKWNLHFKFKGMPFAYRPYDPSSLHLARHSWAHFRNSFPDCGWQQNQLSVTWRLPQTDKK